jgi:hypothetical protein
MSNEIISTANEVKKLLYRIEKEIQLEGNCSFANINSYLQQLCGLMPNFYNSPSEAIIPIAFVRGAQWAAWEIQGATMWKHDKDRAYAEAERQLKAGEITENAEIKKVVAYVNSALEEFVDKQIKG